MDKQGRITAPPQGIARKFAAISIACGVVAAALEFSMMGGFNDGSFIFYFDVWPPLLVGILSMFFLGWLFGGRLGMLFANHVRFALLVGPLFSLIILAAGTSVGSSLNYFRGMGNAYDFILKPVCAVVFWGSLPTLGLGFFWGAMTKRKIAQLGESQRGHPALDAP